MRIVYRDEYEQTLFETTGDVIPVKGDVVFLEEERWYIKERGFYPSEDGIILILTQTQLKENAAPKADDDRQVKFKNAIMSLTERVDGLEKKNKFLSEQLSTVRRNVNNTAQQAKKDQEHDGSR